MAIAIHFKSGAAAILGNVELFAKMSEVPCARRGAMTNTALDRGHDGPCDTNAGRRPRPVNADSLSRYGDPSTSTRAREFARRLLRRARRLHALLHTAWRGTGTP